MGVFNNFPYANFHELNADWIIEQVRKVTDEWEEYRTDMNLWKLGVDDQLAAFQAWFDNLDVQNEVRTVINELIQSGEFIEIAGPQIVSATEAWLAAHITPTTPAVDDTLSISGAAADAKVTGDRIYDLKEDLEDFKDDITITISSKNRFNPSVYTSGKFVSQVDGKLYDNSTYCASDYIDVSRFNNIIISRHDQNVAFRYALYTDKNENSYVTGGIPDTILDSNLERYYVSIDTSNANYIRFSATSGQFTNPTSSQWMIENGTSPTAYAEFFEDYYVLDTGNIEQVESTALGKNLNTVSGSMVNNTKFEVESNSIRKSNTIAFFGKITNFDTIYVGHGESGSAGELVAVDSEKYYFGFNGTPSADGYAHNLTIEDYIGIILQISDMCILTLTIYTRNGSFTRTLPSTSPWLGCSGAVFAKSVGSVFSNAMLTWNADYQKNKWFFGDSYMTNYATTRWPYYMQTMGYDNALINAYPGQSSVSAYQNWLTALNHGTPKYALWALGMNDVDSGAINANWKTTVDSFIADCEARSIIPILATIPNTPTRNHTYKNAYIKSMNYRYIDFAEAVGASSAGSSWYSGCLDADDTHPTADGARLLYMQALMDFPELMQK